MKKSEWVPFKQLNSYMSSWYTKMAAISLFWNTNIVAMTSSEKAL